MTSTVIMLPTAIISSLSTCSIGTTQLHSIHFTPVKLGLAASPATWPYSTFKSCAGRGLYTLDWIGANLDDVQAGDLAERKLAT